MNRTSAKTIFQKAGTSSVITYSLPVKAAFLVRGVVRFPAIKSEESVVKEP